MSEPHIHFCRVICNFWTTEVISKTSICEFFFSRVRVFIDPSIVAILPILYDFLGSKDVTSVLLPAAALSLCSFHVWRLSALTHSPSFMSLARQTHYLWHTHHSLQRVSQERCMSVSTFHGEALARRVAAVRLPHLQSTNFDQQPECCFCHTRRCCVILSCDVHFWGCMGQLCPCWYCDGSDPRSYVAVETSISYRPRGEQERHRIQIHDKVFKAKCEEGGGKAWAKEAEWKEKHMVMTQKNGNHLKGGEGKASDAYSARGACCGRRLERGTRSAPCTPGQPTSETKGIGGDDFLLSSSIVGRHKGSG